MNPIDELANSFMKFPGIGRRQAKRFAYFILQSNPAFSKKLADQMVSIHKIIKQDPESFQYFYASSYSQIHAPTTSDPDRDDTLLMVVEKDIDIESVEKSRAYHGRYFVLGGLAPMIDTDLEQSIRISPLLALIEKKSTNPDSSKQLREVIFALSANTEGDRTAEILKQKIAPLQERFAFKISQLGRGFSTGTEVEYSDPDTLASALENRR
jgi:recombination protein RecR